ncbi:MAG: histone deacetylase [Deltaproteobacteria bacterium]|nr:MAG: histone deacetylase [Deltaproteobacteria bacterium]
MKSLRTGIFYHPSFSRRSYLTVGARLADFPGALSRILERDDVEMFESPPVSRDLILKVHTESLIEGVKRDPLCSTAWHSAGGVVLAGEKVLSGEIRNAFAFIGAGGHHAGRSYFGGYCCFNDVALSIVNMREKFGARRFAILDTDAHHGDGTRDIFQSDPDVLHVCVCGMSYESADGTKVDLPYPSYWEGPETMNERYFSLVREEFPQRAEKFRPDLIFWYFGFDTHAGDYGDIGLTAPCYLNIARLMVELAENLCEGRLIVVLGGGSHTHLATRLIPPIIEILAEGAE